MSVHENEGPPTVAVGAGDNRPESREARTAPPAPTEVSDGSTVEPSFEHAPAPTTEPETPAEAEPWTGPSQEEWQGVLQGIQAMQQFFQEDDEEEELVPQMTAEDLKRMELPQLLNYAVDSRLSEFKPYVEAAIRAEGEKRQEMAFTELEKHVGKFDHGLAGVYAESIFAQSRGTESDAGFALQEGAKLAAEFSKREREQAIEEYKASLNARPNPEPGVGSSGTFAEHKAKSYDEVALRWQEQYGQQSEA